MFNYRLRLFSLLGFEVRIDASWLLLAVLIVWSLASAVFPTFSPGLAAATYWWMAVVAALGLFFSIILHETAHSLVARRYGIEMRGITLFVFGGVAEMADEPASARGELLMALAGPAASLVIAALLLSLAGAATGFVPRPVADILRYLGFINAFLALFNMLPAFPLDGGRVLRAALWAWRGDPVWATRIAAGIGNAFAILLMALGLLAIVEGDFIGGMWRFLLGLFLRAAASSGYERSLAQQALRGVRVAAVMNRQPHAVPPDASVADFIEDYVYRYHHRSFPVQREGRLLGLVGTPQAAALERARWPLTPVSAIMVPATAEDVVAPESDALAALTQMQRSGRGRLLVARQGDLVGILSLRDMLRLLAVTRELGGAAPGDSGQARRLRGAPGPG